MGAYFSFTLTFKGSNEAKELVKNNILEQIGDCSTEDPNVFSADFIEAWAEYEADEFVFNIIRSSPDAEFKLLGVIDTSEKAGEYMNVEYIYKNHTLEMKSSGWYLYFSPDDWESVEDFNEEYEKNYTEKDFENFSDGEWFIDEDGYIVNNVPCEGGCFKTLAQILKA